MRLSDILPLRARGAATACVASLVLGLGVWCSALRAEGRTGWTVVSPGRGTSTVPILADRLGRTRRTGRPLRVLRLLRDDGGTRPVLGGMSGSPVFHSGGHAEAFVAAQLGGAASPYAGAVPAEYLRRSWLRARRAFPSPDDARIESSSAPEPGSSVVVLAVWGDWSYGWQGTLSELDGREVATMAHVCERVGPCVRALAEAPIEWVEDHEQRDVAHARRRQYRWGTGQIVGSVYYESPVGVFGRLGPAPPSTQVSVRVRHPGGEKVVGRVYVAQDPRRGAAGLEAVFAHAISDAAMPGDATLEMTATLDGSRASYRLRTNMRHSRVAARALLVALEGDAVRGGAMLVDSAEFELDVLPLEPNEDEDLRR